jgi:hypothetical protein
MNPNRRRHLRTFPQIIIVAFHSIIFTLSHSFCLSWKLILAHTRQHYAATKPDRERNIQFRFSFLFFCSLFCAPIWENCFDVKNSFLSRWVCSTCDKIQVLFTLVSYSGDFLMPFLTFDSFILSFHFMLFK